MITGTYRQHRKLITRLPPLVLKQRRLAARIATVADAVTDEKTIRGQIDQLLIAAGLKKGDLVTCAGYDVRHHERDGQQTINGVILTALLMKEGIEAELIARVILEATDTADPALFATITPTKGALVRPPTSRPAGRPTRRRRHVDTRSRRR